MFFKGKKRREAEEAEAEAAGVQTSAGTEAVGGTMPEVAEAGTSLDADLTAELTAPPVPAGDADAVRLFPGFEHEDFEVGFRMGGAVPALVMRWKEGGEWFRLPAMFNRAVLASMDERDSAGDLTRLMRSFGYDVG